MRRNWNHTKRYQHEENKKKDRVIFQTPGCWQERNTRAIPEVWSRHRCLLCSPIERDWKREWSENFWEPRFEILSPSVHQHCDMQTAIISNAQFPVQRRELNTLSNRKRRENNIFPQINLSGNWDTRAASSTWSPEWSKCAVLESRVSNITEGDEIGIKI